MTTKGRQHPDFAAQPGRSFDTKDAQRGIEQAEIGGEDPLPEDRHRHAGQDRRQVVDGAEDSKTANIRVEQHGDRETKDNVQRYGSQRKDHGDLQRMHGQRVGEE